MNSLIYVLMFFYTPSDYRAPAEFKTQEFNTQKACETAKRLESDRVAMSQRRYVFFDCVPKG